jgi:hypothetical protein
MVPLITARDNPVIPQSHDGGLVAPRVPAPAGSTSGAVAREISPQAGTALGQR